MMTSHKSLLVFFCAVLAVQTTSGANILGLFTSHSQSHLIVHMSVVKALAEKGHNVTVISGLKPKVKTENVTVITIPPSEEGYEKLQAITSELSTKEQSPLKMIAKAFSGGLTIMIDLQTELLESEQFKNFYNTPDTHFDLVILGYFMNDFELGVASRYNCPVVVSWSGPPMELVNAYIGNPAEVAYVPNIHLEAKNGVALNFKQRLQNLFGSLPMQIVAYLIDLYTTKFYKYVKMKES